MPTQSGGLNIQQALAGAGSLLAGLNILPGDQTTTAPAPATNPGRTTPAATTFTGGAAPSSAPAGIPMSWVIGGSAVALGLVVLVLALRR